ncbi:hypothetical protein Ahy_A04g018069 isoform C [Arachis hypogaea]|uniref:Uncharacterized protein n=1 Tax=Arachis hypogaea TaxID=3818 RepID=A0A445DCQ5_ARAHY|nr:hypothetical protein Ahy_A04g018069 isoform C [Arachis hypogaea]
MDVVLQWSSDQGKLMVGESAAWTEILAKLLAGYSFPRSKLLEFRQTMKEQAPVKKSHDRSTNESD